MTATEVACWHPADPGTAAFVFAGQRAHAVTDMFRDFAAWITLPDEPEDPVSPLPRLVRETRELTGWGQRDLAAVLGTSHTTVRRL